MAHDWYRVAIMWSQRINNINLTKEFYRIFLKNEL